MSGWAYALVVLVAATGIALLDTEAGVGPWHELRDEARAARARVEAREAEVGRLGTEIAALGADPLAIERAIREDLELARPGEWVVRFASPGAPGQAGRGPAGAAKFP